MNMTPTDEAVVLKQDALGRVKTPKARREQLLDEFERSGLTGQKFAAVVGLKYQTLATWIQKRRRARGTYQRRPKQLRWLEAVVEPKGGGQSPLPLVLALAGGAKVHIHDVQQAALAAALLRALAQPC